MICPDHLLQCFTTEYTEIPHPRVLAGTPAMKFDFIAKHRREFSVTRMCTALGGQPQRLLRLAYSLRQAVPRLPFPSFVHGGEARA